MLCVASICLVLFSGELIIPSDGQPVGPGLDNIIEQIGGIAQKSSPLFENFGGPILEQVHKSIKPLIRSKRQVHQQEQKSLKPLNDDFQNARGDSSDETDWSWATNLGDQITKQVEEGLKPVYEMEVRLDMENGRGGNTVVTFKPDGKTLIIQDGRPFECPGSISDDGVCSENLEPLKIRNESDKCYLSSSVVINGQVCLSVDNSVSVVHPSEGLTCRDSKGQRIEPMSLRKYEELCKNSAMEADYKYVTNKTISSHKPQDIQCSGSNPMTCRFSNKKKGIPGNGAIINNVSIKM